MERAHNSLPYLTTTRQWLFFYLLLLFAIPLAGCSFSRPIEQASTIKVSIEVDGKQTSIEVPSGTTAQGALDKAGISLNNLDRLDPPSYTLLSNGVTLKVTRVREEFTLQETVVPFERQTVRNESLPEGQTLLVQTGVNGVQQVTYRQVYEDDKQVSNTIFKTEIITEPLPEIIMVGVQKPFSPVTITGSLAYLAGGNAWLIEKSTGNRRPLVTTGDLDGYIFSLSPQADWLLFSRKEKEGSSVENTVKNINSLWVIHLTEEGARPISLKVNNVIHFADWVPGQGQTILYSTVEPRSTAPGWQANNDLHLIMFATNGLLVKNEEIIQTNAGGLYGWWGTNFAFSPDGALLAYARPDSVGLVDLEKKELKPLVDILPFQTGSDWAWVTGLSWSSNHRVLYFVSHAPKAGLDNPEASPLFNLSAVAFSETGEAGAKVYTPGPVINLVPQSGIFSYPVASPLIGSSGYQVAYLQAIFPEQSENNRYRLVIMDRDGSNKDLLFPPQDYQGMTPSKKRMVWSPQPFQNGNYWLAVIYQGNIWLVDSANGQAQQITGDGLISWIDWK